MIKYKGQLYKKGNEYNGVIELWDNNALAHLFKQRKNGVYFKWYL